MQMKQITMDPAVPRSIAKLQYAAARLPFTLIDEYVIARYWGQHALVRVGLERWLGSLDLLAGRLLADDEISRRGETLMQQTRDPAQAPELRDQIAAFGEQEDSQQVRQAAGEQVTAGHAPPAADPAQTGNGAGAAGQPGTPDTPAAGTAPVDVTFTLPAEVQAGTVALCGEFNDWSAGDTRLERGSDGSWQATIALEPGRSYRYRYLLDDQRWENDERADHQVPNALGSIDSVVVVG